MKTVVITGGSRGIGAAAVRLFAGRGARVWFLYEKNHEAARAVARETGAQALCCDVADEAAVQRAFDAVGSADILVNNAGVCHYGLISQITPAEWRRLFAVNVDGVYHCCRAAMPHFIHRKTGSIVTVASMWGQVGASCEVAYSATKGAVIAFTKALAKELGPSGIRVNCVSPGTIDTEMNRHLTAEDLAALAEETPLERIGTPEEAARAIAFLAGDEASFITGQVLAPNGGMVI